MQLFIDLDGVLADFDKHHYNHFGFYSDKKLDNVNWEKIKNIPNFYRDIPPMNDMGKLWDFCKKAHPIILTGIPSSVSEAEENKKAWVERWIGKNTETICCRSFEKYFFCERGDILVDDWEKYKHKWEDAGGIFITHTSANNTISQLQNLFSFYT